MTTIPLRDQIVAELDQLPETTLAEILAYVQSLKPEVAFANQDEVWQAYLATESEHEEVYRRLADS